MPRGWESSLWRRAFKAHHSQPTDDWIPTFHAAVEHDARATLEDFGKSTAGYELFPFNRAAIRELSRVGCIEGSHLVYNPRFVIQNVIYTVLNQRDLFERGQFPPSNFGTQSRPLVAKVVEEVRRRVPPRELERYLKLLTYWAGFPETLGDALMLGPRVFTAFGLDRTPISKGVSVPTSIAQPKKELREEQNEASAPKHERHPTEKKWEELFESWRAGKSLPQTDARELRKWIAEALKGFVEWDWELHRPLGGSDIDSWFEYVYLPLAAGHGARSSSESMVAVCSEADVSDVTKSAAIQSALMSVIRFHSVHKGSWDYPGAEEDLPRYCAFLEGMIQAARDFVMRRYFRPDWDPIPALVEGLLIGARALGSESATKDKNPSALIHSLFEVVPNSSAAPIPNPAANDDAAGWDDFTAALRQCRRSGEKESRDQLSWQGHLLSLVGARQGQADSIYAIDVTRLKAAIEKTLGDWEFTLKWPISAGASEYTALRAHYSDLKKFAGAIAKQQKRLHEWRKETIAWLGDPGEKEDLVNDMKLAVQDAKEAGMTRDLDPKGLLQLLEDFRNTKVVAALQDCEKLDPNSPHGTVLTVLGRGYEAVAQLCEKLDCRLEEFLAAVEGDLARDAAKWGSNPLQDAVTSLTAELDELATVLQNVESL